MVNAHVETTMATEICLIDSREARENILEGEKKKK
jgi:hypothetical protein|tara:strand:+ start:443 stop:547 length:105 start_codon:yes stop_codon:yes gene_type:complete